jgi:hypothetical protein
LRNVERQGKKEGGDRGKSVYTLFGSEENKWREKK